MKVFHQILLGMISLLVCVQPASSGNLSPGEKAYVGGYTKRSVDSLTRLVVLDDHTYCFAVTAGSLDLLTAGHWKSNPGRDAGITLQEVRKEQPLFPALIKTTKDNGKDQGGKVTFLFHGYSLSNSRSAVFAFSANDEIPREIRPLFPASRHSWAERYSIPPVDMDKARYFLIGHVEHNKAGKPERLKVFQYSLGSGNTVLIGFDENQARPLMNMTAKFDGKVLHIGDSRYGRMEVFGKKDILTPAIFQDVRKNCTIPVMQQAKNESRPDANVPVAPVKVFNMELDAVKGEPWIKIKGK